MSVPQVFLVHVLQLPDSLPVEDMFSGFRINGQHWFLLVHQISQQRHDPF